MRRCMHAEGRPRMCAPKPRRDCVRAGRERTPPFGSCLQARQRKSFVNTMQLMLKNNFTVELARGVGNGRQYVRRILCFELIGVSSGRLHHVRTSVWCNSSRTAWSTTRNREFCWNTQLLIVASAGA